MNKRICLLLAPVALLAQDAAIKFAPTRITVTTLGAVLADAPTQPVLGTHPNSTQVDL
jgi:hypothetical protein